MQTRRGFMAGAAAVCGALASGAKATERPAAPIPCFRHSAMTPGRQYVYPTLNGAKVTDGDCFAVLTGEHGWAEVYDHERDANGCTKFPIKTRRIPGSVELRTNVGDLLVYGFYPDGNPITEPDAPTRPQAEAERIAMRNPGGKLYTIDVTEFRNGHWPRLPA